MAKETKNEYGPAGATYNGSKAPTSHELGAPVKIYPASSKLGHDRGPKDMIEGPCDEAGKSGMYHRK